MLNLAIEIVKDPAINTKLRKDDKQWDRQLKQPSGDFSLGERSSSVLRWDFSPEYRVVLSLV
jgi:hypothetical protein